MMDVNECTACTEFREPAYPQATCKVQISAMHSALSTPQYVLSGDLYNSEANNIHIDIENLSSIRWVWYHPWYPGKLSSSEWCVYRQMSI